MPVASFPHTTSETQGKKGRYIYICDAKRQKYLAVLFHTTQAGVLLRFLFTGPCLVNLRFTGKCPPP